MRAGMDVGPELVRAAGGLIDPLDTFVALECVLDEEAVVVDAHLQEERARRDEAGDVVGVEILEDIRHDLRAAEVRALDAEAGPGVDVPHDVRRLGFVSPRELEDMEQVSLLQVV